MNYPTPDLLATWAATIAAAAAIAFKVWRSSSKTTLDNRKDTVEGAGLQFVLDRLQKQNEELRAERDLHKLDAQRAWSQRMEDAKEISDLRAENQYLKRRVEDIATEMVELRQLIKKE
jgi:cell division protein FtsB